MRKILCLLLCAFLLLSACAAAASAPDGADSAEKNGTAVSPGDEGFRYETDGFGTPEAAVLYFLDGLKNMDFGQMLDAYAWETRVSRYSAEEDLRYNRTFTGDSPWLPGQEDAVRQLNLEAMREGEADIIYSSLAISLLPGEKWQETVQIRNREEAEAFLGLYDGGKLESLREMTNIRFLTVNDVAGESYLTMRRLEQYGKDLAVYGMDELKELPVIADVGGEKLFLVPAVARYGDSWYLFTLDSRVTNYLRMKSPESYGRAAFAFFSELPFSGDSARNADGTDRPAAASRTIRYEGNGFSTPEEAVACYLEGLKNRDLSRMLRAFAWETLAERYDPEAAAEYYGMVQIPATKGALPKFNGLAAQADVHSLRSIQIGYIYRSFMYYLLPDSYLQEHISAGAPTVPRLKEEDLEELIRYFGEHESEKLEKLSRLGDIRFMSAEETIGEKSFGNIRQAYLDYMAKEQAMYGADEIRDIAAVADLDGEPFYAAQTAVRYGDRWYIASVTSVTNMFLPGTTAWFSGYGRGFAYGPLFPLQ